MFFFVENIICNKRLSASIEIIISEGDAKNKKRNSGPPRIRGLFILCIVYIFLQYYHHRISLPVVKLLYDYAITIK